MTLIKRVYGKILIAALFLAFFSACDEPPVDPVLPDVLGCNLTGEINLNYISKKVFFSVLSGNVNQYSLSSIATIDKVNYALTFSIFPKTHGDTSGVYSIIKPGNNTIKENYAYALFISGYKTDSPVEYWATEGSIILSYKYIGQSINSIKGTFNLVVKDPDTGIEKISVPDGWIDFTRSI